MAWLVNNLRPHYLIPIGPETTSPIPVIVLPCHNDSSQLCKGLYTWTNIKILLYLDQHFLSFLHPFLHITHHPAPQVAERSECVNFVSKNLAGKFWEICGCIFLLWFESCSKLFCCKNNMFFFTFLMIFEILLERSVGRLELQCNQAWYSLERKFIKPGLILKKKCTESMQFGDNFASFKRHCYPEI